MRKAMVLTFLLLTVTLTAVCVTAAGVYEQRDQLVLTENAVYGDIAAAEGLTVELHAHYANHLFWDTTCTFGQETTVETEYSFSAQARRQEWPPDHGGVDLVANPMVGVDITDEGETTGLEVAYRELLEDTEECEEGNRTIYLKDYMDYYPLEVIIGLPGVDVNLQVWEIVNDDDGAIPGTAAYVVMKLREYFRIPVMEDEQYDIHVQKSSQHGVYSWGGGTASTESSDFYRMGTYNAYTADACYFTIETHSRDGKLVDLGLLPEGYGIYRLPYEDPHKDENGVELCGVDVDALEMVYSLDPNIELLCLDVSADQTELMLHALEENGYYMTVIDLTTMETLQRLKIADRPVGGGGWQLFNEGDFLMVTLFDTKKLAVIDRDDSGQYVLRYVWDKTPEELESLPLSIMSNKTALGYDGDRMVLVAPLEKREHLLDGNFYREPVCGFVMAVYGPSGLAYCGEYVSSLNTGRNLENILALYCRNRDYDSLAVTWNE